MVGRWLAAVLATTLFLCASASVAQELLDEQGLIGFPFLSAPAELDREAVRADLNTRIMANLTRLQNWRDYATLPQHKAIAINYWIDPTGLTDAQDLPDYVAIGLHYWGGGWNYDNLADARESALRSCGAGCSVYLEDDQTVGLEAIVDRYLQVRREKYAHELERFREADRTNVLERALSEVRRRQTPYALGAPGVMTIGYPDWQQDYESACQGRVFYVLRPVSGQDRERVLRDLSSVVSAGMYGGYQRTVDTVRDYREVRADRRMTTQMNFSFVREGGIELPPNLAAIGVEHVVRVWLEGSVRVTRDGVPLVQDDHARPLAVETQAGLYEAFEMRLPDPGYNCHVGMPFANVVLSFPIRTGDGPAANRMLQRLLANIRAQLEANPLGARPITNEVFAPGEFGMVRTEMPSLVLGAPIYERSQYTVQTFVAGQQDPFGSLYGRSHFQGVGQGSLGDGDNLHIFLKVHHILTRATHRLGDYTEPNRQEIERFDVVVNASVRRAVVQTCQEVSGRMQTDACIVSQPARAQ